MNALCKPNNAIWVCSNSNFFFKSKYYFRLVKLFESGFLRKIYFKSDFEINQDWVVSKFNLSKKISIDIPKRLAFKTAVAIETFYIYTHAPKNNKLRFQCVQE